MVQVNEPREMVSESSEHEDATSFAAFFEAEHARLLRAMYLVTTNAGEAEDISQDAFLRVWEKWDRVSLLEHPTGYLYRTAMNLFRSRYRRALRAAKRTLGAMPAVPDEIARAEARDEIWNAVSKLSARQRQAIVVTELLGFEPKDAAQILGVKPSTVRALSSQARAALRQGLRANE